MMIYNRLNCSSGRQLWSRILQALATKGVLALSASIDSSCAKAPLSLWRKKRAKMQAIRPSSSGQTNNIHAVKDLLGRPAILLLTRSYRSEGGEPSTASSADRQFWRSTHKIADSGPENDALTQRRHRLLNWSNILGCSIPSR